MPDVQNWRRWLLCLALLLCLYMQAFSQTVVSDSLQKIAAAPGISRYFGSLYYQSTLAAEKYAAAQAPPARRFLELFEQHFAHYFFTAAAEARLSGNHTFSWQRYYAATGLSPFQYYVMGMNAHINGDMWQALVNAYPYDSIKKYRQVLEHFRYPLAAVFDSTYKACSTNKKLRRFHLLTLGLDKWYGKKMMWHWRRNQLQLALWYYSNTGKFNRRLLKTHRYMKRLDTFVIRQF